MPVMPTLCRIHSFRYFMIHMRSLVIDFINHKPYTNISIYSRSSRCNCCKIACTIPCIMHLQPLMYNVHTFLIFVMFQDPSILKASTFNAFLVFALTLKVSFCVNLDSARLIVSTPPIPTSIKRPLYDVTLTYSIHYGE